MGPPAEDAPGDWQVWFRPRRRKPWELVATAPTHADALRLIGTGGRRGGDWLLTENGVRPDAR